MSNMTVAEATAEIERVANIVWQQFQTDAPLSFEEVQARVEQFVAKYEPQPTMRVIGCGYKSDGIVVDIETNDPKLARQLKMLQDKDYIALVDRVQQNARVHGLDAVYTLNEEETALVKRYMDPPIVVTIALTGEE